MSFLNNQPRSPLTSSLGYRIAGDTASRPGSLMDFEAGVTYFDQELGKLLVWSGSAWIAVEGTPIDLPATVSEETEVEVKPPVVITDQETGGEEAAPTDDNKEPAEKPATV